MKNFKNTTYYTDEELKNWIEDESMNDWLADTADRIRRDIYGDEVYIRGLIEFSINSVSYTHLTLPTSDLV